MRKNRNRIVSPAPRRTETTSVRILPHVYGQIYTALAIFKLRHKGWSVSRILNIALIRFLKDLKSMKETEVERLYEDYEAYIQGAPE